MSTLVVMTPADEAEGEAIYTEEEEEEEARRFRLREHMRDHGFTSQKQLAALIGMSGQNLSNYLRNAPTPAIGKSLSMMVRQYFERCGEPELAGNIARDDDRAAGYAAPAPQIGLQSTWLRARLRVDSDRGDGARVALELQPMQPRSSPLSPFSPPDEHTPRLFRCRYCARPIDNTGNLARHEASCGRLQSALVQSSAVPHSAAPPAVAGPAHGVPRSSHKVGRSHHGGGQSVGACRYCGRRVVSAGNLARHEESCARARIEDATPAGADHASTSSSDADASPVMLREQREEADRRSPVMQLMMQREGGAGARVHGAAAASVHAAAAARAEAAQQRAQQVRLTQAALQAAAEEGLVLEADAHEASGFLGVRECVGAPAFMAVLAYECGANGREKRRVLGNRFECAEAAALAVARGKRALADGRPLPL